MTPYLIKWHETYAGEGLRIITVYNGAVDRQFSPDPLGDLQKHLRSEKVSFPVMYDEGGATCDSYGVQGYPSGYLLDRKGSVIWEDCPNGNQARVERKIREALHAN